MNLSAHLSLTALVIFVAVSIVIPLLSSLLVRAHWPAEVAGLLTVVLATANGLLTQWADQGDAFNWHAALSAAFVSLIIAFQARARVWLGSEADRKALAVGSRGGVPSKNSGALPVVASGSGGGGGTLHVGTGGTGGTNATTSPPAQP